MLRIATSQMYTVIPALGKYRQEDYEFEARMDNIERPC
jgi:hypothetical protein